MWRIIIKVASRFVLRDGRTISMNAINSSTRLCCTISKLLGKPLNGLFGEEDENET